MTTTIDILLRVLKRGDGLKQTAVDARRLEQQLREMNARFNSLNVDLMQHRARLKEISAAYVDAAADARRLEKEFDRLFGELNQGNAELDQNRAALLKNEKQVEQLTNELQQLYNEYSQLAAQQDQSTASMNRLESEMEQVENALAQAGMRSDELRADLEQLEGQVGETGGELEQIRSDLERATEAEVRFGNEAERLRQEIAFAEEEISQLSAEMNEVRTASSRAADGLEQVSNEARQAAAAMDTVEGAGNKVAKAAKDIEKGANASRISLKNLGESILLGFGIGTGIQIIEEFVFKIRDLSNEIAELGTDVDFQVRRIATTGASDEFLGGLVSQVTAVDAEIGRLSSETMPTLYAVLSAGASAGITEDNVFERLALSSDAALAGSAELLETIELGTGIVSAYGAENMELVEVYDLLFTAVNESRLEFSDLTNKLSSVTAISGELQLPLQNVTAGLAAMNNQGLGAAESITSMARLLDALSKEGKKTAVIFEEETGKSFRQFIADGGTLADALQILEQRSQRTGETINDMFGEIRAARAALLLTGEGAKEFSRQMGAAADATGATGEAVAKFDDSMLLMERRLNATKETTKILIAEAIEPMRRAWIRARTDGLDGFNESMRMMNQNRAVRDILDDQNLSLREYSMARMAATREDINAIERIDDQARTMERARIALDLLADGYDGSKQGLIELVNAQERFNEVVEAGARRTAGSRAGRFREEQQEISEAIQETTYSLEEAGKEIANYETAVTSIIEANGISIETFQNLAVRLGGVQEAMSYVAQSTRDGAADNRDYTVTAEDIAAAEEKRAAAALEAAEAFATAIDSYKAKVEELREVARAGFFDFMDEFTSDDRVGGDPLQFMEYFSGIVRPAPEEGFQAIDPARYFGDAISDSSAPILELANALQYLDQVDRGVALDGLKFSAYQLKISQLVEEFEKGERPISVLAQELNDFGLELNNIDSIQEMADVMERLEQQAGRVSLGDLEQEFFDTSVAAGLSVEQLMLLGDEFNLFGEDAQNAALKTALIKAKIDELVAGFKSGNFSLEDVREELRDFVTEIESLGQEPLPIKFEIKPTTDATVRSTSDLKRELIPELAQLEEEPVTISADTNQAETDIAGLVGLTSDQLIPTLVEAEEAGTKTGDSIAAAFQVTSENVNIATDDTRLFIETLYDVPPETKTEFTSNIDEMIAKLQQLLDQINRIPDKKTVTIDVQESGSGSSSGGGGGSSPTPLFGGGRVQRNQPVIVGDGPGGQILPTTELFIPDANGYIMSGRELARALATSTNGSTGVSTTRSQGDTFIYNNFNERAAAIAMADTDRRKRARISRLMGG